MSKKIPCPICGKETIEEAYDICPYCGWEYEEAQMENPIDYDNGGPNTPLTIKEARKLLEQGLTCMKEPLPFEKNWRQALDKSKE